MPNKPIEFKSTSFLDTAQFRILRDVDITIIQLWTEI